MPKRTKARMKNQSFTCSNPDCEKVFTNPVIVQDLSSKNPSSYHACPNCLTEIVEEEAPIVEEKEHALEKIRAKAEEVATELVEDKPTIETSFKAPKCPHSFGYLSHRAKKEEIPEECMTCEKIVQCMLKNVTS